MIVIFIILLPVIQSTEGPWDPQDLQDLQDLQHHLNPHIEQYPQANKDPRYHQNPQEPHYRQNPEDPQDPQFYHEAQDQCSDSFCSPQLGDLMIGRASQLWASSTCGLDRPESFCIVGYLEEEQKCFFCDSRLPYDHHGNQNSHRIENIITTFDHDRKRQWWQSENGVHHVSIRLDLETVFQFSHMILTFKSFRPAAMLVERSRDFGRTWKVFRYFSDDCSLHFPSVPIDSAHSADDVICDSRYSGSEPSTNGEVVLKALDPVFEIQNPYSPRVQELITLTNIRVNLTHLFTLGDTLLNRRRRDPQNKYYYALYNMVVQGSCFCNGHAHRCVPIDGGHAHQGMVHSRCVCQHNTDGENCERCKDLHHDTPWRPGGENTADICRRCQCHGLSNSCHFDPARFEATGGVSGGVCDDCRHHRGGPHCEQCRPFFYRDPSRDMNDPQACIPCECSAEGSHSSGCDVLSGQCACKENVEGRHCDRCKPGFFNMRHDDPEGCQVCRCHPLGSLRSCDQLTGSCECDRLATGPLCDRCVDGFWGLGNSQVSCSPCDCDLGGAVSSECSPEDGQCQCLPNMVGRRCSDPAPGYFLPSLDLFLYEAELAAPLVTEIPVAPTNAPIPISSRLNPTCEQYFRSLGYDFKVVNDQILLIRKTRGLARRQRRLSSIPLDPGHGLQIIPRQTILDQPDTWTGLGLVRVAEGAGLRFTVDNIPSSMEYHLVIRYKTEMPSDWLASVSIIVSSPGDHACSRDPAGSKSLVLPGNRREGLLDSTVCLNAGARYFVDVVFRKSSGADRSGSFILIDSMALIPSMETVQDFCSQTDQHANRPFRCSGLNRETNPHVDLSEVCTELMKKMSFRVHGGPVVCRCNHIGSVTHTCSKMGGFCECQPNVIGRCCDACAPLTFGFGPAGCKSCHCDPHGSASAVCEEVTGQCDCRPNVIGLHCERCGPGFWGFPLCRPCDCNGLSEDCDDQTGECRNCRQNAAGPRCSRCQDGYFGDPISGLPCQLCSCPDVQGSGHFFATSCQYDPQSRTTTCQCQEGHTGPRCERCLDGYFGDLSLPGARCEPCPCNNNIDIDEAGACDRLTGECLRCLGNTTGPRCQHCKPGFYGDPLNQDCKECSCDRRGTEVTQCPLGSPCICDPRTGQCPCRTGVTGVLCDTCEDRFWNLNGPSGCQACGCDPLNSASSVCDKVTGQCPCRAEFGGRQCDECGENHFGNPDFQCVPCDCNLEGTVRPSCDPETGECLCRPGVAGILCDECAPGYSSAFPACEPCHPCAAHLRESVADVQKAAERMKTFLPVGLDQRQLRNRPQSQRMLQVHSMMDKLANLSRLSLKNLEKVEKFCLKTGKLKDALNPNLILVDLSPLLDTDIENIRWEFKKLLKGLKEKAIQDLDQEEEDVEEFRDEIKKLLKNFLLDEKKVNHAHKSLEDSMETRQKAEQKLGTCKNLTPLEKKIKDLSVVPLNQQVCGYPSLDDCSGCGGALCRLSLGRRKCGGPNCDGALPVSQNASETARQTKNKISLISSGLENFRNKVLRAGQRAKETKDQAKDSQERINQRLSTFEKEKNKTKELIQRAKDYLRDDSVPPEDIEKMARAVLRIHLPRSPAHVQSMIDEIHRLLSSTKHLPDLKDLEQKNKAALDLLQKAQELKEKTMRIDVTKVRKDIYDAERAQDQANDDLETASQDRDMAKDRIRKIRDKVTNIEEKLMARRPEDLSEEVELLKKKSQQNRAVADEALKAAEAALNSTDTDLEDVLKLFEVLKLKNSTADVQGKAGERARKIMEEAENMRKLVEDKLLQIQDLDRKVKGQVEEKNKKLSELSELLKTVESLQEEISKRAEEYASCTS